MVSPLEREASVGVELELQRTAVTLVGHGRVKGGTGSMYNDKGERVCSVEELWQRADALGASLSSRVCKGGLAFIDCQDQRFSLIEILTIDLACLMAGLVVTTAPRQQLSVVFSGDETYADSPLVVSPAMVATWSKESQRVSPASAAVTPQDGAYIDGDGNTVTHAQLWASISATLTFYEGRKPVLRDLTVHLGRDTLLDNRDVIYHQLCCGYSAVVAPLWKPELFRMARPTYFVANVASLEAPMTFLLLAFDNAWFGKWAKKIALATPKNAFSRALNHMQWIIADTLIFPRVISRAFGARLEWIYCVGQTAPDAAHCSILKGLGRPLVQKNGKEY